MDWLLPIRGIGPYSAMLILFNLIVDVLYRWVDPRIETGSGGGS